MRPITPEDKPDLLQIFTDHTVATWWGEPDKSVDDTLHPEEGELHFIVEVDGKVAGMVQSLEETDPMYRRASLDIALRHAWQGRGIGPDAIRTLAGYLIKERGHHRLTIDPAAHNVNAIKAYERVGFRRVGVMRQYERGSDGKWHDGLLMEMLADELRD